MIIMLEVIAKKIDVNKRDLDGNKIYYDRAE